MSSRFTSSWQDIIGQEQLSEARIAAYERLMEAEQQIAEVRMAQGVSDEAIERALEISEADVENLPDHELVVSVLGRFVAELGGRLELRPRELAAVFPEHAVLLRPEPGSSRAS